MGSKRWNFREVDYLKNSWGEKNLKTIAKDLGRSVYAIKLKAQRLGLYEWLEHHDCITLNKFHELLFGCQLSSYTIGIWKRAGMPIKNVRKINKTYQLINLESFINW